MTVTETSTRSSAKEKLSSPENQQHQYPVKYAYDYLKGGGRYLARPSLNLNHYRTHRKFSLSNNSSKSDFDRGDDGIDISPHEAGLPWPSGILNIRQNKHWQIAHNTTEDLLQYFITDETTNGIVKSGQSLADLAQKELASKVETGWANFSSFMYPDSEPIREKLIADFHVYIFMFDEFWEMNNFGLYGILQDTFINRMRPSFKRGPTRTPLQARIDETIDQCEELDTLTGNTAGREVIDQMVLFFDTPPPEKKYRTLEKFIQYRSEDAAVPFVLACAKFSINSSVDINAPKLQSFGRLVRHHISVANDLGSFEKEKKAFDTGKALYMINAVQMVKELIDMPTYDAALGITQAVQMQIETDIDQEIDRSIREEDMTSAQWRYIDGALFTMTGNVYASVVLSRYGGEKTRLA